MASLLIRIAVPLQDYKLEEYLRPKGPLFHRWLPDGTTDSFELPVGDKDMELRVWFERRGFVDNNGFIVYAYDRREVDSKVLRRQAILDAGPLIGHLRILNISQMDIDVLEQDKIGDQRYINLGKRILKAIFPPLAQLISLLRLNYGQYWIPDLDWWDSRRMSLGSYCSSKIQLLWSNSEGQNWKPFLPTTPQSSATVVLPGDDEYERYLQRDDYLHLAEQMQELSVSEPSLAATTITSAHRILDSGNLRHAFIEGVIALELAIYEYIRSGITESKTLTESIQPFWGLSLKAQLISITARDGRTTMEDLERAIQAIETRNRIVHDGFDPPLDPNQRQVVLSLLKVTASLLQGPEFRFPQLNAGNKLYLADD